MTTLLCLIVLFTSIVGFFSQEFIRFFKRMFSIPGVKLILPLLFASFIIESYALWGWKGLSSLRSGLLLLEHRMSNLMPFQIGNMMVTRVLLLVLLSGIPAWITWLLTKKHQMSNAMFWAYRFGALVWLVSVILLISLGVA